MSRLKTSKTTGDAVNPFFALSEMDMDAMHFYLLHEAASKAAATMACALYPLAKRRAMWIAWET